MRGERDKEYRERISFEFSLKYVINQSLSVCLCVGMFINKCVEIMYTCNYYENNYSDLATLQMQILEMSNKC